MEYSVCVAGASVATDAMEPNPNAATAKRVMNNFFMIVLVSDKFNESGMDVVPTNRQFMAMMQGSFDRP